MIATLLSLTLAVQGTGWQATPTHPTVGDTVLLERSVPVPAGAVLRLAPLEGSAILEPLGPPEATHLEGRVRIRYVAAPFAPGNHSVQMPSAELIYPDGRTEIILGGAAALNVISVLPSGIPAEPRWSSPPIPRRPVNVVPPVILVGSILILLALWVWWRRRVGPRPDPETEDVQPAVPVDQWLAAGEVRAVAAVLAEQLRERIAGEVPAAGRALDTEECMAELARLKPDWPLRDLGELLRELDRARFAPLRSGDLLDLPYRAKEMMAAL